MDELAASELELHDRGNQVSQATHTHTPPVVVVVSIMRPSYYCMTTSRVVPHRRPYTAR